MKKLFILGALFAVGLGFTACSSDDTATERSKEMNGDNYIAVSINLPSDPSANTRADNNGVVTLDDGVSEEYAVKNAILVIFDGSENFIEAHDITTVATGWTDNADEHVTKHANGTNIVKSVSNKVFAGCKLLVVLNNHGLLTVTDHNLYVKGSGTAFSGTFSSLQSTLTDAITTLDAADMAGDISTKGLYMANAPLSDTQGSVTTDGATASAKVQVLVPITATYKTIAAAEAGTPDNVYVERGMAKVTVAAVSGKDLTNAKINGSTAIEWETTAWTLDNTNPTSYLIRETASFNGFKTLRSNATGAVYRTIGNTKIGSSAGNPTYGYRVYFSKGTQFDTFTSLNRVTGDGDFKEAFFDDGSTFAKTNPQYCYDNTFSVLNQDLQHTTLIQLKTTSKIHGGAVGNLYTIGTDKSTVYQETTIEEKFKAAAAAYVETNKATLVSGGTTIKSADFGVTSISRDASGHVNGVVMTYAKSAGDAVLNASAFSSGTTLNTTICSNIASNVLAANGTITKYVDGASYYTIRIRHFNALTPWNDWELAAGKTAPSGTTTATIYPDNSNRDGDYLGRYGVLRNNWYHISVGDIRFLGDAVPHTGAWDGTPDDELDEYIAFKIYILSWAKRTQSVDL